MAIATARRIGLRYCGPEERVVASRGVRGRSRPGSRRPPDRCCRDPRRAAPGRRGPRRSRPRPTSQRGLSGVGSRSRKNSGRGDGQDAEHPPPFRRPEVQPRDQVVRQEREQDAEHDVELLDRHQTAAVLRRGDLGDVERRDDRRPADGHAAQESEGEERVPVPGQGAAQRGRRNRGPPGRSGAFFRPQTSGGRPARIEPKIVPISAMATVKPRDDSVSEKTDFRASVVPEMTDRVEPEEQAAQGRDERAADQGRP